MCPQAFPKTCKQKRVKPRGLRLVVAHIPRRQPSPRLKSYRSIQQVQKKLEGIRWVQGQKHLLGASQLATMDHICFFTQNVQASRVSAPSASDGKSMAKHRGRCKVAGHIPLIFSNGKIYCKYAYIYIYLKAAPILSTWLGSCGLAFPSGAAIGEDTHGSGETKEQS